jgi:DNA repair exonuclease SbcCD nuclease subunit
MRLIITADIHNGIPGKLKDCIWAMNIIRQYAQKNDITDIIILGDLFHDRVSLNIDVLNEVYDFLNLATHDGQSWWCFPGNHDLFLKNSWRMNSLHVFQNVINIVEDAQMIDVGDTKFCVIPFVHYESEYMKILNDLEKLNPNHPRVLLTHIGVKGATLNQCFLLKNWSIVDFVDSTFDKVFAGHFHCHQDVGKVTYPGGPIPFNFDEGAVEHGFIVYDTDTNTHEFIKMFEVCKQFSPLYKPPDFITILDEDLPQSLDLIAGNNVRVMLTKAYTNNELVTIKTTLRDKRLAHSVSWLEPKEQINEDIVKQTQLNGIGTPEALFKAWRALERKTDDLSEDLLMTIHEQIVVEAEERIVVEDIEE